jgi:serine/threonine-protein kinase
MVDEAANLDPLLGVTLGGLYRVERLLGVGGMGRVYQARHELLGKDFAVKVLPEGRAQKPAAAERFLREARAASQVENEHIVTVVNADRDDQHRLFIVMELLVGENLADRIARGPLALDAALDIAAQTGDALQAAHDAGIVHRDLKPENIFLIDKNGRDFVKVLDFGISKIKNPEHGDPKLTATDQIVGTPLYISPELARGVDTVDHRTDIYALGVILYEMITGTPPFTGSNHFQLLYAHGNETPDPPSQRSERANVPPHVEAAILKALEKNPDDRFSSMHEFLIALGGPTVPKRARTFGVPLLVAALAAIVAFVAWPKGSPAPDSPAPTAPPAVIAPPATATKVSDEPKQTAEQPSVPEMVTLRLESRPKGAFVAIDGERRGRTPLAVDIERGVRAKVRFSLRGYVTERRELSAESDQTLRVRLEKKSQPAPSSIKTDF